MIEPPIPDLEFDWSTVAAALFAANDIKSGLWRVGVKMSFAALTANWEELGSAYPTAMLGMNGLALFKADAPGAMVFDAAATPAPAPKKVAAKAPARKKSFKTL